VRFSRKISFNPQQVLGIAATTDTHHHPPNGDPCGRPGQGQATAVQSEKIWQDFVFPDNVCWFCINQEYFNQEQKKFPTLGLYAYSSTD